MLGHFLELPLPGIGVVAPEDEWLVVGVVVEVFVAAWAAMPPPTTNAPDMATARAALWILRILLTSLGGGLGLQGLTKPIQAAGTGQPMGDSQEEIKTLATPLGPS
jgi:hypothetical protein